MADPVEMLQAMVAAADRAMAEERIGAAARQRVVNRLVYGSPEGPGSRLTDAEAEAAYMRSAEAQAPGDHVPAPAPGQPLFDRDGREIPGDAFPWPSEWAPVTTQCRCGQQIARTENLSRWEHF